MLRDCVDAIAGGCLATLSVMAVGCVVLVGYAIGWATR
jgi:hypothetical protein